MPINISDAQALNYLRQQTRVTSAKAFEVQYDIVDYAALVPVNTDYPEWASGADFQIGDLAGAAKWQSGWAEDVPKADVSLISVGVDFAMYAVGYGYNVEELGKAMHAGFPLTARKAVAARQAADIFCAETALYGGGHPGWTGLINKSSVTPVASPNTGTGSARNWVAASGVGLKTSEQIVAEMNSVLQGPPSSSGVLTSLLGNTVLLPAAAMNYITNTPYGVNAQGMTIYQYFLANNVYTQRTGQPVTVRELPALAIAGTATGVEGQGRVVGYRNSPDAIELPMPMPYNFLDVHQSGPLQWNVPGIGRVGQLTLIRDGALRYLDGVTPAPGD